MNRSDLDEIVLLQLECFWRLQEFDKLLQDNDPDCSAFMDRLYSTRPVSWRELHPLLRLKTTLAQVIIPVSFAFELSKKQQLGQFTIKPKHELVVRKKETEVAAPSSDQVVQIMRHATAHLPAFASGDVPPNISFDEGVVRFWTKNPNRKTAEAEEVIFKSERGFVSFLQDLFALVRKATIHNSGTSERTLAEQRIIQPSPKTEGKTPQRAELRQLEAEGWRLIQEFAPFQQEEMDELPNEVAGLKLWAKSKLFELERLCPDRQEWQAAVSMAIETAYRVGRMPLSE